MKSPQKQSKDLLFNIQDLNFSLDKILENKMLEMIKIHKNYYLSFQFLDGNHFHRDSACYLTEVYVIENQKFAIFHCSPYSFLNLEIQWSHYIRSKVTVHECAETT